VKKILILGGGIGGTIVANKLARKLLNEIIKGNVEIKVLDKKDYHVYQPSQLLVALGLEDYDQLMRSERVLLEPRIKFLSGNKGNVIKIDLPNHRVITEDGNIHEYDYLIISTGSHLAWDEIKGYREKALSVWDLNDVLKIRESLEKFKGGTIVINVSRLPIKCPVAPVELTLMVNDFLKQRGIREKSRIVYTYPAPGVFGIKQANDMFLEMFKERGIEVISPFIVDYIEGDSIVSQDGERIKFDLLLGVPPHKGAEVLKEIGDRRNWVSVDKYTLNVKGYDNVYAIGDTTDLPISKAGSVADFQSGPVSENIVHDILGMGSKVFYDGSVFCFCVGGIGTSSYIRYNYNFVLPVPKPTTTIWWMKLMYNRMYWSLTARAVI
jgi:sulfide:quinone oxidoreductase